MRIISQRGHGPPGILATSSAVLLSQPHCALVANMQADFGSVEKQPMREDQAMDEEPGDQEEAK